MKVKEHLGNLFSKMKEQAEDLLIFSYMDCEVLDTIFINLYGERTLSRTGKLDIDTVATVIVDMYGRKWDRGIELYLSSLIDINKGGYTLTENNTSKAVNNLSRAVLNKVSAFNDDEMTDNIEDLEELEGTNDNTDVVDKQVLRSVGIDNIIKIMNFVDNYYVYDIMMLDINSMVSLNIY